MNLWMFDKTHYVKYARVRVFSDIFLAVIILHIRILSPKLAKHNLTHFWPMFPLYAKGFLVTKGFLVFSGDVKWENWQEMG